MAVTAISPSTFDFLRRLKENNNRPWFNDHKAEYEQAREEMIAFAEELMLRVSLHDELEPSTGKKILFRIYRDVRFSKDKSPYKAHFSGSFVRATKWRRGGYYFHIAPDGCFVGGGFWAPNSEDLKRIRQEIAIDAAPLRKIIAAPDFVNTFESLEGDQLKTAPRGYPKDHPNVDLLRYKQFLLTKHYTNKEAMTEAFADQLDRAFQHMRPLFNFMSETLTTDINGVPIE